jgi:hypothetical protein
LAPFPESPAEGDERPIFLLATGWRTGSTLLQRILVTDPRLLLWGEPLGRMGLLSRLAEAVCGMTPGWPPRDFWIDARPQTDALASSWIANLFPSAADFRAALRQLFQRWLAESAGQRGYTRWGLKEVRLGAAEATILRWLYAGARFVVLTRDPAAAYRSMKGSARDWCVYARWPDRRVDCVLGFARHWERLASSWADAPPLLAPLILRYEDLVADNGHFEKLGADLGLDLDPSRALATRIGATEQPAPLSRIESFILQRETSVGRRVMGYGARAPRV